jgi:hypothetical protein
MMNGGPISWTSRKQTTVALSTMEAEYMALSDAAREALAHLTFFQTLSIQIPPPIFFNDNEAAEAIVKLEESDHQRSQHIDIRYDFLRHEFERGSFDVQHIPRHEQIADIFTKPHLNTSRIYPINTSPPHDLNTLINPSSFNTTNFHP